VDPAAISELAQPPAIREQCLHLDVRRHQPSAAGRDSDVSHLLRSLYRGPLGRKKLPLALPGAFSLAKLSGSPWWT
jgi:hypothetical protein